ncbi:type II toxin-antitoxin system VapC family toxin [Fibrisoma montanum]|uniref:Ribonuclease VapC n=1 Tax=Fibrisoma montanum TaxID=2305895 RepID=A0A418M104_9BACT|nr:type II toxin-antitoxin system VapC family toxin [Fibrisoma montanum]RIV19301.1 type II toxin-antitoxin system VapC family toxin [Fibrisoma montanum]
MADKIVLADTSLLIDLFRKTDKANSVLVGLVRQGYTYSISAVTEFEIYTGAALGQIQFWDTLLQKIQVLPFDKDVARIAVEINSDLKRRRKQIAIPDLFIAATAISNHLPLATLNKKHFERVDGLLVI